MNPTQEPKASAQKSTKSGGEAKKRTMYRQLSMLALPEWAKNDKEHHYRWVSKRRVSRSDGFDPRGWVLARDPKTNESLEAFDLILHKMPLEEHEAMMDYKRNLTRESVAQVLEHIEGQQDRLKYEVERLGGRLSNTEFTIERKA